MDGDRVDSMQSDVRQFRLPQQNGAVRAAGSRPSSLPGARTETVPWQETQEQTPLQTAQLSSAMGH